MVRTKKYDVYFYDPFYEKKINGLKVLKKLSDLRFFDCIVFCVKHEEFNSINFKKLKIKNDTIVYDSNLVLSSIQQKDLSKKNIFFRKVGFN